MLTQTQTETFSHDWIDSWNSHDLEKILSHYSEDIIFISPFVSKLLNEATGTPKGKTALRSYFAKAQEKYPDLKFHLLKVYTSVQSVTLTYESVNDLLAAEVMEFNGEGKVQRVVAHYSAK